MKKLLSVGTTIIVAVGLSSSAMAGPDGSGFGVLQRPVPISDTAAPSQVLDVAMKHKVVRRKTTVNVRRNTNVNIHVHRRPVRGWVHRPYYGTVMAGVVLGTIIVVSAAGTAPAAPNPNMCWYWSNASMSRGYWDYCKSH